MKTARAKLADELKKLKPPQTLAMQEMEQPRMSSMFVRGNFLEKGEPVRADVPAVLHTFSDEERQSPDAGALAGQHEQSARCPRDRESLVVGIFRTRTRRRRRKISASRAIRRRILNCSIGWRWNLWNRALVGRVTPCAPRLCPSNGGAQGTDAPYHDLGSPVVDETHSPAHRDLRDLPAILERES